MREFSESGPVYELKKIGANKASVFNGYCGFHDNMLFSAIDNAIELSDSVVLKMALRSLTREILQKENMVKKFRDKIWCALAGLDYIKQRHVWNLGNQTIINTKNDISKLRISFLNIIKDIESNNLSNYKFWRKEITKIPKFVCSSTVSPKYDLKGNMIQDLDRVGEFAWLHMESTIIDGAQWVCFVTDSKSKPLREFMDSVYSFLDNKDRSLDIFSFYCENIYFKISWHDSLPVYIKQALNNSCTYPFANLAKFSFSNINWDI